MKEKQKSEALHINLACAICISCSRYLLPLFPYAETPDNKTLLGKRLTKPTSSCSASCWLHNLILKTFFLFFIGRPSGKADQCQQFLVLRLKGLLVCSFSTFSYFVIQRNLVKSISALLNTVQETGRLTSLSTHFNFTPHCVSEAMHDLVKPQAANMKIRISSQGSQNLKVRALKRPLYIFIRNITYCSFDTWKCPLAFFQPMLYSIH